MSEWCLKILPFLFLFHFFYYVFWLVMTITGIGPLFQWYSNLNDQKLLDRHKIVKEREDMMWVTIPSTRYSTIGKIFDSLVSLIDHLLNL
jgi:hypothetical protein